MINKFCRFKSPALPGGNRTLSECGCNLPLLLINCPETSIGFSLRRKQRAVFPAFWESLRRLKEWELMVLF